MLLLASSRMETYATTYNLCQCLASVHVEHVVYRVSEIDGWVAQSHRQKSESSRTVLAGLRTQEEDTYFTVQGKVRRHPIGCTK